MKHFKYQYSLLFILIINLALLFNSSDLKAQSDKAINNHNTHTLGGEHGALDYVIIWGGIAIVVLTLVYSIKFLIRPKENDPNHIKNIVKNEGF